MKQKIKTFPAKKSEKKSDLPIPAGLFISQKNYGCGCPRGTTKLCPKHSRC